MSNIRTEARARAFFELYSQGEVSADKIDDFVGRWHDGNEPCAKDLPLHEYLGLSHDEYEAWVYDANALPQILEARQSNRSLAEAMAERFEKMRRANRPEDGTTLFSLGNWLRARAAP